MKKDSLIFAVALLVVTIGLLIPTFAYPFKSKLFPSIALFTLLVLLVIQVIKEVSAWKEASSSSKEIAKEKEPCGVVLSKYFAIWAWLAGTLIMLWIFGFMGTVILLPFLYFRFHRESWIVSVTLPLGCGVFFYTLFGWALRMPLYPGILLPRFFE
jgi:hypothetical protein